MRKYLYVNVKRNCNLQYFFFKNNLKKGKLEKCENKNYNYEFLVS